MKNFKFYVRKTFYGYSLFTPDRKCVEDFKSKQMACRLRKRLNEFLKSVGVFNHDSKKRKR